MLLQPTFITEYLAAVSPLARRNDQNLDVTDRFEFFIGGASWPTASPELNDAEDQAERFQAQVDQKAAGDDEAMFYDADFLLPRWNTVCRPPPVRASVSTAW